jgi:hypothetical protein
MDHTTIIKLSDQYRKDFYLYGPENLSRRILEERVRNEVFGNSFTYFEIPYKNLVRDHCSIENQKSVWKTVLFCLSTEIRGCDLKGFAEENRGLAIVLLDSQTASLPNFLKRLNEELNRRNLLKYVLPTDNILKDSTHITPKKKDDN